MDIAKHWRQRATRYRFEGQRHRATGEVRFPPQPAALGESADTWETYALSGKGEIYSFSVIRQAPTGFEHVAPYPVTLPEQPQAQGFEVPLLGVITAGQPLPDPEDTSSGERDTVEVPPEVAPVDKLKDVYALRVRGQSMIDALIDDGDIVLLRFQETAENGQMVAAMLVDENAVTLKKFYHEGHRVRLQPANKTMDPIFTAPDNVRIQGRVVGVLRSLI